MKKLPLLFAAFLVVSASGLRAGEPSDIHTLLRRLDGLLDRREEFLLRHEARLDSLKSLLCGDTLGFGARYAVTAEIAERYFAYQSDSTIATCAGMSRWPKGRGMPTGRSAPNRSWRCVTA